MALSCISTVLDEARYQTSPLNICIPCITLFCFLFVPELSFSVRGYKLFLANLSCSSPILSPVFIPRSLAGFFFVFFFRRLKIFYSWIIFITLDVSFLIYYHSRIIPSRQLGISSPSVFSSSCTLHSVFVLASPESSLFPSLSVLSNHLFVSFLVGSLLLLFYDTCLYAENFFLIVFNVLSRTIYMDFSLCSHHDFTVLSFIYLMKCKFFITCILQSPSLTTSAVPLYFPHRQFYVVRNLV